jgi:hypothetical protein
MDRDVEEVWGEVRSMEGELRSMGDMVLGLGVQLGLKILAPESGNSPDPPCPPWKQCTPPDQLRDELNTIRARMETMFDSVFRLLQKADDANISRIAFNPTQEPSVRPSREREPHHL